MSLGPPAGGFEFFLEIEVTYTIRYQRAETPYGVTKSCVPPEENAAKQVRRLQALGYTILDVTPPLAVAHSPP